MLKRQLFSIVCLLLALSFDGQAQDIQKDTLRLSLYFKTGASNPTIESRQNIERAMSVIPAGTDLESVVIEGWASPEGSVELNTRIANRRASTAETFLLEYFASLPANTSISGRTDWKGMMHYCSKYFAAEDMDRIATAMRLPVENRKSILSKLDGGRLWKEMDSEVFPLLRRADITIIYYRHNTEGTKRVYSDAFATYTEYTTTEETVSRTDTVVIYHKDTVYYLPVDKKRDPIKVRALYPKVDKQLRRPVLAFRTNLLMPLLNVGVEVPVSNRWSVAADFYYPWIPRKWMNNWTTSQMTCMQAVGGYVEGRYWFGMQHREREKGYGKYRLLGHSLALLGGGAYYDVELKGKGQQGELAVIGIDYMYSMPLGRKGSVHLAFDVAIGAVYHAWHPYEVNESGVLLHSEDGNGIVIRSIDKWSCYPIRAGISLSVPIFTNKPLKDKRNYRRR